MSYDAPTFQHIGYDRYGYLIGHAKKKAPKKAAPVLSGGKYEKATNSEVLLKCGVGDKEAITEYEYRGGAYNIHNGNTGWR